MNGVLALPHPTGMGTRRPSKWGTQSGRCAAKLALQGIPGQVAPTRLGHIPHQVAVKEVIMKRIILLVLMSLPTWVQAAGLYDRYMGGGTPYYGEYIYINPPPEVLPYSPYHERYYRNYELNKRRYETPRGDKYRRPEPKGWSGRIR